MIADRFDPKAAEPRLYKAWEDSGAFQPQGDGEPFSIVIPPPNVTGVLHMGHALNNTLQDVLARFERMRGKRVLWQPGTDHAGIATQMVVERQLAQEGNARRQDMGREEFLDRVWKWKAESGGAIVNQLKRLGASCDWSRERFTMDEGLSRAVTKVFVDLYREGLIYRDKRLVNWDPHFETAISDLEVENREVKGHMWRFKYPLQNGETYRYVEKDADGSIVFEEERDYISIATTRPETMLGDGAVAVHPSDERYRPIIGKLCEIPVGPKAHRRLIPIIVDDYPDPNFGSGAVKITGAHDFNDYQVARRNGLPLYRLMDEKGAMRSDGAPYAECAARAQSLAQGGKADPIAIDALNLVPETYRGRDRMDARKRVIADIDAEGLMLKVEDKTIMQPFGDRSGVVIEPMLTDQWYVNAGKLAKPAVKAVEKGETRFVPEVWAKTYFEWMRNIEPWCISRQLWWGHRIPAWYGPEITTQPNDDGGYEAVVDFDRALPLKIFVAASEEEALAQAREHYRGREVAIAADRTAAYSEMGQRQWIDLGAHLPDHSRWDFGVRIWRDEDVLDTWFSSALWPFSTMGWPGAPDIDAADDPALAEFYPTSVLVTAFDIIFFWVARMMMQGLHFMGEVPFKDVYIHALVLDEKGQKMSKSKGNVIDPIELVDEFGADALRMTLAAMAAQGRNIRLSKQRVEGYRNFATKLWSAYRFAEMNECRLDPSFDPKTPKLALNRWIVSEASRTAEEVTRGIREYRFNEAAGAAYRFTWNVFCDWYVELIKPVLNGEDEAAKAETRAATAWAIDQIVHLLHPFMPYVTEELFGALSRSAGTDRGLLLVRRWPELSGLVDEAAEAEVNWVIRLITAIRSARADLNVPVAAKVPLALVGAGAKTKARLKTYGGLIERLARLDGVKNAKAAPEGSIRLVIDEATACLKVADLIDVAAESARLRKEIAKAEGDIATVDKKLANEQFVAKAPPEVVEEQHERRAAAEAIRSKLSDALSQLEGA